MTGSPTWETGGVHLTKHHGLGNDFLVLMDLDGVSPIDPPLARALCHRRTGVGADGLIRVTPGRQGADLTMELLNSDGSAAEMSGNGMRCLAQAAVMAGAAPASRFTVWTAGGVRHVVHGLGDRPGESRVTVDMGRVGPLADAPAVEHRSPPLREAALDVGNPHLVLLVDDPATVEIESVGPTYECQFPSGANIEWIRVREPDTLDLRVWERGAGATQACGTGACAAAWAAHRWDLVGPRVDVVMPGGGVRVEIGPDGTVRLTGPAAYVAAVDVEPGWLM